MKTGLPTAPRLARAVAGLSLGVLLACSPAASVNANDAPAGKRVFEAKKCGRCHREGGKLDLAGVGKRRDAAWLKRYLQKQEKANGKAHKPDFEGTQAELDALVAWLAARK